MKSLISTLGIYLIILLSGCTISDSSNTLSTNCDPKLVGKWIRKNKYHLDLYSNGIGSIDKDVVVNEDIMKFKEERINWVSFNNNFLLFNSDEKLIGFSYQIKGDTLFLRQPEDNLEFFVKDKENESLDAQNN